MHFEPICKGRLMGQSSPLGVQNMFSAKIVITAIAFSTVSALVFVNTATYAADEAKAPSWQAQCGYKWRQHKATSGETGRASYTAFMRLPVEQGGCGAKAARTTNDEAIKQYMESHPVVGPKTEIDPAIDDDNGRVVMEARGKKR
jgi:hypothetical protein